MDPDDALLELMRALALRQYHFITPTPLTQARVLARAERRHARTLADVFGWNLAFDAAVAGDELLSLMRAAEVLRRDAAGYRSAIRIASLDGSLFAHSAFPTEDRDAVFFGPDTYRFARFVAAHLPPAAEAGQRLRCADIGCGGGAGAISAARRLPGSDWLLADTNPAALRLARINAAYAGLAMPTLVSDVLAAAPGRFDLLICNPPYLADDREREYRDGGGELGSELSLRIAGEALARLNPGGRLLLYTGVAIVDGEDRLLTKLRALLDGRDYRWRYAEIDPDVFGEELEKPAYAHCDRIAVVGLVVDRPALSSTAGTVE